MARTKKKWLEGESNKKFQENYIFSPYKTLYSDITPVRQGSLHDGHLFDEAEGNTGLVLHLPCDTRAEGFEPSLETSRLSLSKPSPTSLPRAVVLLEDVCRPHNPGANMVKKPVAKNANGITSGKSSVRKSASVERRVGAALKKTEGSTVSRSPTKNNSPPEGRDGNTVQKNATQSDCAAATGDKTVSSTTPCGSKNIFEQFMVSRRSPRKRSNSPRCKSSLVHNDSSSSRSGSEEKQSISIATAVKALRVLSDRVSEVSGQSRSSRIDKDNAKGSRNASPGSTSPRGQNSASPKRQSPRRAAEKMTPPSPVVQKSPKQNKSPSVANSDSSPSSSVGKRMRSPRKCVEGSSPVLSSSHSSQGGQDHVSPAKGGQVHSSAAKNADSKPEKSSCKGERSFAKGDRPDVSAGENTIHILSSTSRGSKVIQVDQRPSGVTARKLFMDSGSGKSLGDTVSQQTNLSKTKTVSMKHYSGKPAPEGSVSTPSSEVKKLASSSGEETESLLCAMLVGGSEVTRHYEQSREHNTTHVSKAHAVESSSDMLEQKTSDSQIRFTLDDSFFSDDLSSSFPEEKPYELPVLSSLPPLNSANFAVLELTETENCESETLPDVQPLPNHRNKTEALLSLISRVEDHLPPNSKACRPAVSDAEKVLSECSSDKDPSDLGESEKISKVTNSKRLSKTEKPSSEGASTSKDCDERCQPHAAGSTDSVIKDRSGSMCVDTAMTGHPENKDKTVTSRESLQGKISVCDTDVMLNMPGSPCSLGELDTAMMTQAATKAVQNQAGQTSSTNKPGADLTSEKPQNGTTTPQSTGETVNPQEPGPSVVPEDSEQSLSSCQPSTSSVVWQASGGGLGKGQTEDTASKPDATNRPSTSQSQSRSFFSRISSHSKQRWKPKTQPTVNPGKPGWSRWHTITLPLDIDILGRHESKTASSKRSAFSSKELDRYLHQSNNRVMVPASNNSRLAKVLQDEGHMKDYSLLQRQLTGEILTVKQEEEASEVKSEEEEEAEDDERDSEVARKLDPDFDEVEGLVFVSFPSEMAAKAHVNLVCTGQWDGDPMSYMNMAKFHAFEESRRKDGNVRRESQGLRGQHMKWRRYQRLYRHELRNLLEESKNDIPWPLSKLPAKTSDVNKIKNWRKKFGDMRTEEMEALELLGEDEERIKRKRKTYIFSSKKKKMKRSEGVSYPQFIKQEREDPETSTELVEEEEEEEEEEDSNYGVPIPIDQDSYMDDVQSSIQELQLKEKGLKQSKGIFARYKMGPEDRYIFKKLGGWNTRCRRFRRMPQEVKAGESGIPLRPPRKRPPKKDRSKPRFELVCLNTSQALRAVSALHVMPGSEAWKTVARDASCHSSTAEGAAAGADFVDLTAGELRGDKLHCDKPGCRYGCICHLCLPSTESDETDPPASATAAGHTCDKEYCRLGCICDSLEKSGEAASLRDASSAQDSKSSHSSESCGKGQPGSKQPHKLTSMKQETSPVHTLQTPNQGDQAESSGDELPTLEKTTAPRRQRSIDRYSNLPRRQTSYRMAKNLDAVSRKAMMMWETSEVFSEQTTTRRKKVPETAAPSVTTSAPHVPQSVIITSPSSSSPSSTTTTHHTSTVSASASVSTLPAGTQQTSSKTMTAAAMDSNSVLPAVQQNNSTASAAVSVNTLPDLLPAHSVSTKTPTSTLQSPVPSEKKELDSVAGSQDGSAVVVSDDDGKPDSFQSASPDTLPQTKRPHLKKKLLGKEEADEDVPGKKRRMSGLSPPTLLFKSSSPAREFSPQHPTASQPNPSQSNPSDPNPSQPNPSQQPNPSNVWQTSLICLKANNPATPANSSNDDVMEEDEIKLFEFMFNCPWERSKKEILMAITNTLKRGVYPEPRVMCVGDFRVEILPKASRPSSIPLELRNKLPKSMYSVRVRVMEMPRVEPVTSTSKNVVVSSPSVPAFLPVVTSVQEQTPVAGKSPGNQTGNKPAPSVLSPSMAKVNSVGETASPGNVGISGLGRLQITQNTTPTTMVSSQGQHFKIHKDSVGAVSQPVESVEKKKKKKKKKKKSVDLGDDSLVPGLSNLTVSPRKSQDSTTSLSSPPLATSTPTFPTFRFSPLPNLAMPRGPGVSPVNPPVLAQPIPVQPISRLAFPAPGSPAAARPQLLGLPNLPANLSGIKFLQLPGQNNLLHIVPASALGLKNVDNKNIPNFVAVPVSLTSIAPPGLQGKKVGSRVQIDVPSKVLASGQPSPARQATGTVKTGVDMKNETASSSATKGGEAVTGDGPVKKKKKKKKKKPPEGDSVTGDGPKPASSGSGVCLSSPLLVAESPSPVMSLASSHPVHTLTNMHTVVHPSTHTQPVSCPTTVSQPVSDNISLTTGETTVTVSKSQEQPGKRASEGSSLTTRANSGHASCLDLSTKSSAKGKTGPDGTAASPGVTSMVASEYLPDRSRIADGEDDSLGSWPDYVDLSSDSEPDIDADQPTQDGMTESQTTSRMEQMANRRDSERRRRDEVAAGFRKLKNVLNVANNLPKCLSQYKILSKTINLIQYHQKLPSLLKKTMAECTKRNEALKRQLKQLTDKKLAEGMSLASVRAILSKAALLDDSSIPPPGSDEESSLVHQPRSTSSPLQQSRLTSSTQLSGGPVANQSLGDSATDKSVVTGSQDVVWEKHKAGGFKTKLQQQAEGTSENKHRKCVGDNESAVKTPGTEVRANNVQVREGGMQLRDGNGSSGVPVTVAHVPDLQDASSSPVSANVKHHADSHTAADGGGGDIASTDSQQGKVCDGDGATSEAKDVLSKCSSSICGDRTNATGEDGSVSINNISRASGTGEKCLHENHSAESEAAAGGGMGLVITHVTSLVQPGKGYSLDLHSGAVKTDSGVDSGGVGVAVEKVSSSPSTSLC